MARVLTVLGGPLDGELLTVSRIEPVMLLPEPVAVAFESLRSGAGLQRVSL